jgi:hypothetical protein
MLYARINLEKTNYQLGCVDWDFIDHPNIDKLNSIYYQYCKHKKFKSVVPIFDSEYLDPNMDVIGYYHYNNLVAFSLIKRFYQDEQNVEAFQFAWDYKNPELKLGFKTLENECALYKNLGYKWLYLGGADEYKSKFDGFEILGPVK